MKIVHPTVDSKSFTCPHCGVLSAQDHLYIGLHKHRIQSAENNVYFWPFRLTISVCHHCQGFCIWTDDVKVYPESYSVPPPNAELPEDIQKDYLEAASIAMKSPRGAAALLRLCVQKLCIHLGTKSKNIDEAIAELVQRGLPPQAQQSLDYVRVIGNEAVHPGQIDVDDPEIVGTLFLIVNSIAEIMIENPKKVESLYNSLPTSKLDAIKNRDTPKSPKT